MRIFISAGEPSGDLHAANLIRAIRHRVPDAEIVGFGGPCMKSAGARLLYPLVNLAVMWFLSVFANIITFVRLVFQADRYFREHQPDAVVLIDYPGLHWWIAHRAKIRGIPVFYFVPPQIWAWAGWRVSKIRRDFDQVLCSLPFEPAWYQARGYHDAHFVGHPYFDELAERPLDAEFLRAQSAIPRPLIALLPGSRTQEVLRNLPDMIRAAAQLSQQRPDARFAVACFSEHHKTLAERIIADQKAADGSTVWPQINLFSGRTPELIRLARLAWAVSGSVGLELMMETLPTVVIYKIKQFDLWVARQFIKSKFISLVNLLANDEVFPEYLTYQDTSPDLVRWALEWIDNSPARSRATTSLRELRSQVAQPGASDRAAERILNFLAQQPPAHAGPETRYHQQPAFSRTRALKSNSGNANPES
jgi:lipid-A-disaccharide synthase